MDPQHCLFPKLTGTVLNAVFGIRDVYPGSRILILPIPDPKTATEERSEKKFYLKPFYVATNFTKLKIIFVFKCWRKKFGPVFKDLQNFLAKKLSLSSQKYGFGIRDPRSGIRDPEKTIPEPGSRGQKGIGSRIRIRNTDWMLDWVVGTGTCSDDGQTLGYSGHSQTNLQANNRIG
jgi:hypothetical protein